MKRKSKIALGVAGALFVMQLVRLPHDNPPVTGEIQAPPEVMQVLRRSCWDCHSNQTVWPWYSQVAPASFLVYRDVVVGRGELNFSEWNALPAEKQRRKRRGVGKQVDEGEMPPWFYLPLHATARLSDTDRSVLDGWSRGASGAKP
jgi:hypothetical protein